jgi:hypothetical protein
MRSNIRRAAALTSILPDGDASSASVDRQGYALTYWQVDNLRHLDDILFVNNQREPIEVITREVAQLSADVAGKLETFASRSLRRIVRDDAAGFRRGARPPTCRHRYGPLREADQA